MKNNQQNHIGTFLYLIQVQAVLFTIISAASYYRPSKLRMVVTVSCTRKNMGVHGKNTL